MVTSPAGTDLTLSVDGRQAKTDTGDLRLPGQGGNLPCGEVFISPSIASCKGTIIFDDTLTLETGGIIPKTPVLQARALLLQTDKQHKIKYFVHKNLDEPSF